MSLLQLGPENPKPRNFGKLPKVDCIVVKL